MQVKLEREGNPELFEDLQRFIRRHPRAAALFLNPAGFVFLFGWFLSLGILIGWLAILVIAPQVGAAMMTMVITEFTLGREVAIPLGIVALGLPVLIVFGIAFTQDLITTTWFYPLFYVFRRRQRGRRNFWGYFFRKIEADAEARRDFVEKYGAFGLFFFMLIPFAVNGPLIGAIIGKLVGIRTRYILPTVILATATATAMWTLAWVYARPQVEWFVSTFGGQWIAVGLAIIFGVVLLRVTLSFLKDIRNFRRIERRRAEIARRLEAGTVVQVLHAETEAAKKATRPPTATAAQPDKSDASATDA